MGNLPPGPPNSTGSLFIWFLKKFQLCHLVTVKRRLHTKWNLDLSKYLSLKTKNHFYSITRVSKLFVHLPNQFP
jgi:hypothetical protein